MSAFYSYRKCMERTPFYCRKSSQPSNCCTSCQLSSFIWSCRGSKRASSFYSSYKSFHKRVNRVLASCSCWRAWKERRKVLTGKDSLLQQHILLLSYQKKKLRLCYTLRTRKKAIEEEGAVHCLLHWVDRVWSRVWHISGRIILAYILFHLNY